MDECKLGYDDLNTGFVVAINIEAKDGRPTSLRPLSRG
jgi:hypothetical protein